MKIDRGTAERMEDADERAAMAREVREGLARAPKELPPKFFYDHRGSELFERITRLPEYYPTRAERRILAERIPDVVADLRPRTLVELGAGSGEKTRLILDAMRRAGTLESYVPIDVSAEFLEQSARRLRTDYPGLRIEPVVADFLGDDPLPTPRRRPAIVAFLGSTIGNLSAEQSVRLLTHVRESLAPFDRFLLGVDLRKDVRVLERAYNDSAGVTAEFNRNMLRVIDRELGADFDLDAFEHRAFYDRDNHQIEMHLVARGDQEVHIPGAGEFVIADGESIRTEISRKYDRRSVERLLDAAGMRVERWMTDPQGWFAVVTAVRAP